MKFLTIQGKVSKQDIKRGQKKSPLFCPLARAIRRASRIRFVRAGLTLIRLGGSFEYPLYIRETPLKFSQFMKVFDKGGQVKPFSFKLRLEKSDA